MSTAQPATHRTFDCPWCGAINQVDASRVGEHYPCPECKRETKLTSSNTSDRPPTAPPPDAPHLSGDRTFDCPWCGAISSVPSAHLGERFQCPECRRDTKLTAMNARRAPVTAPPPDAPSAEPPPAKGLWLAIGVVAVLAGLGLWFGLSGSGASVADRPDATTAGSLLPDPDALPPESRRPPTVPTPGAPPVPAPDGPAMPTPPPTDGPPEMPTPTPPPDEGTAELERAKAEAAAALLLVAEKTKAQADALAALEKWRGENPEYVAAQSEHRALGEIAGEAKRVLEAKAVVPDPDAPTPDQVRAFNAAVAAFVEANPDRVRAAEALLGRMRGDPATAGEVSDRTWKQLNWFGPGVRRALAAAESDAARRIASLVPAGLAKAYADSEAEAAAAKKASGEADARLRALESPPPK